MNFSMRLFTLSSFSRDVTDTSRCYSSRVMCCHDVVVVLFRFAVMVLLFSYDVMSSCCCSLVDLCYFLYPGGELAAEKKKAAKWMFRSLNKSRGNMLCRMEKEFISGKTFEQGNFSMVE